MLLPFEASARSRYVVLLLEQLALRNRRRALAFISMISGENKSGCGIGVVDEDDLDVDGMACIRSRGLEVSKV
jgi:hypothetical protein